MRTNKPVEKLDPRLARGEIAGSNGIVARQTTEAQLRRLVMAHLLWENDFYQDGVSTVNEIERLVPQVDPYMVAQIAYEARHVQKLRHTPLKIAVEMSKAGGRHRALLGSLLPTIITRPDQLGEFLALYWQQSGKHGKPKAPLASQVKKGLAAAFENFDAYQLAKYAHGSDAIKLRDVLFLVHARPETAGREELYKQLAEDTLPTPDTWEVELSRWGNNRDSWMRLITENRLGALAYLRNLRNMATAGVNGADIIKGMRDLNPRWLLPVNFLAAREATPQFEGAIQDLMLRSLANTEKLPGMTDFVVDVSGSMRSMLSGVSQFNRLQIAAMMAVAAQLRCEKSRVWVTAGRDYDGKHATEQINAAAAGFDLYDKIMRSYNYMGGGGIFTRQALEHIRGNVGTTNRIIIFSDSQDIDAANGSTHLPEPFGETNYIVDVSAHRNGINYQGVWTAEIAGWSNGFLDFIAAMEGLNIPDVDETEVLNG